MRFATIRTDHGTTAARLDGDELIPLAAGDVGELLAGGGAGQERAARERDGAAAVPVTEADFAPVVTRPGKVICVGLNYAAHIEETTRETSDYPVLFTKFATTLAGPYDPIPLPPEPAAIDYEGELVVVDGERGRRIARERIKFTRFA